MKKQRYILHIEVDTEGLKLLFHWAAMITEHTQHKYTEMSFTQKHHILVRQRCTIVQQASGI